MKDGFIKIAAGTPEIRVADCGFNKDSIVKTVKEAAAQGVKLLALPELCVTGCTCGDLFFQQTLIEGAEKALRDIARETASLPVIFTAGAPFRRGGKLLNGAAVFYKGEILGVVSKKNLSAELSQERCFDTDPYEQPVVFRCRELPDFAFGVEIGEDLSAVEQPSVRLAAMGAAVILNPSASGEIIGRDKRRRCLVSSQSSRLACAYVCASAGNGESTTDMVFGGHNIIGENGLILAESKLFCSELTVSEADVQRLAFERRRNKALPQEEAAQTVYFSMSAEETKLTRHISSAPFIPANEAERTERCEAILAMQSAGLKKRLEHAFAKTAVIGISGGLDSCLALLAAVRATDLLNRPRTDILAVTMPCFGTTSRTKSNAQKLCELLGVSFRQIDITASVTQHFADIGHDINDHSVTFENSQARERTQVIMDIANQTGGIVVGTGDLSELALGWATYHGHQMSMYGGNAGIPKTLTPHVVKHYSNTCGSKELSAVLDDILATPVSPELLPAADGEISQKTEDLVGPYELHDFFLYYTVRCGFPPEKILRLATYAFDGAYSDETVKKWLKTFCRRFFNQQFKRSCSPDGPKIGSVSLSPRGDWRMPSDASAALWSERAD